MPAPTVAVTVDLSTIGGEAVEGVTVRARLDVNEVYEEIVISKPVEAVTDANGVAVLDLFPNAPDPTGLGTQGSTYRITAAIPGGRALNVNARVPNNDCRLETILVGDEVGPLSDAELAVLQAQASVSTAASSAAAAATSATAAATSATAAATSSTNAAASATAAAASEAAAVAGAASAQFADYDALRDYAGTSKNAVITGYLASTAPSGIAGIFTRDDSDTTSADNGGTIIVASNGKRWKRVYSGAVDVRWFGAVGDGTTDDTAAIQAAVNLGERCILFPAGTYLITSKITWTGPRDFVGDGVKQTEILCEVDDWSFDNPSTSARSLSMRKMKLTGDQTKTNNAGIRVFDNGDRPFADLEINGFKKAGLRVVQSVNPILRNIRGYNCALGAGEGLIEIDKGATSIVSAQLDNVYVGSATIGVLLNGARNAVMKGLVAESCTTGLKATDSDGILVGGWMEANVTEDFNGSDSTIVRNGFIGTGAWNASFSGSTDGAYRKSPILRPGYGGVYNADDRAAGATATWTDLLFSSEFEHYAVGQVPFDSVRVREKGQYRVDVRVTFRNADVATQQGATRLVKGGVEIPGSYSSASFAAGEVKEVSTTLIVDCADEADIKVQFCVSHTNLVVGKTTTGLAAATHATSATMTVQFLQSQ